MTKKISKIDDIVISCYPEDLYMTRVCVASIRYWYPNIPIWLLKDRQYGDFSTREIENNWAVQVYPTRQKRLGWGFGKLDVITEPTSRRILLLDSDTAFVGRVIDELENFSEDFVVEDFDEPNIEGQFFSLQELGKLDPSFVFPGYGFNTGQIVFTSGRVTKADFAGLVNWESRTVLDSRIFKMGEQGVLNYVVLREVQKGRLSIRRARYMAWPGEPSRADHILLQDLTSEGRQRQIIHWAGLRWGRTVDEMPRSEILTHFEEYYYRKIRLGYWIRRWRRALFLLHRDAVLPLKEAARKLVHWSK